MRSSISGPTEPGGDFGAGLYQSPGERDIAQMAARNRTLERHAALSEALAASSDIDALAAALLAPPLYRRGPCVFTAYTAVYRPILGTVDSVARQALAPELRSLCAGTVRA